MNKLFEMLGSHETRVPIILGLLGVNHVMHLCPSVDLLGYGLIALAVSSLAKIR